MGTFSIWHWLVVLVIVVLVFGTKKLRNLGGDLGSAIKGFKEGMKDANTENASTQSSDTSGLTFDDDFKETVNTTNSFKEPIKTKETAAAATQNPANDTAVHQSKKEEDVQKPDSSTQNTGSESKDNSQSKA